MDHILFSADYNNNLLTDEDNPNSLLTSKKFLSLFHRKSAESNILSLRADPGLQPGPKRFGPICKIGPAIGVLFLSVLTCEDPCPISNHALKNSFSPVIKSSYVSLLLIVEKLSPSTNISHVRGLVL